MSSIMKTITHDDKRSGEHIGMLTFTRKKVKSSNNSAVCDHLFHCSFLPSFNNFSILAH